MPFKKKDIENLLVATGRKCCICGELHNVQVHHIIAKEHGGSDMIENGIPLCPKCHDRVHVKPSSGRTTRDYSPEELRLHRAQMIKESQSKRHEGKANRENDLFMEPQLFVEYSAVEQAILPKVTLSSLANEDCKKFEIRFKDARTFIEGEIIRHPLMFQKQFSSLPLIFGDYIILLNWDCCVARIERILTRQAAYPLNDQWTECLGFYRKATLLPYRTQHTSRLLISSDAKLAMAVFRNLTKHIEMFIRSIEQQTKIHIQSGVEFEQFLDEAEFALVNEDVGTAIARLEFVLSTAHKLILQHAPQGIGVKKVYQTENPKVEPNRPGVKSILLVDDELMDIDRLKGILENKGYQCHCTTSSREAMQILVESDFDLIITDLMMFGGRQFNRMDGRELVIAAKKSGSRAKIIVLSAFSVMGVNADIGSDKFPCDLFINKFESLENILSAINGLLSPP
jgi:CheY-like chemotaxis protein